MHRNSVSISGWNNCGETALSSFGDVSSGVCASITSGEMSCSSELLFSPFVVSSANAFAAWCLVAERCTSLKSNFDN